MNLDFRVLRIENFKAYRGPVIFNLARCGPGLHFVRGQNKLEPSLHSNGAGKSSLWDALVWCLYGRTVDNLRNPDIRPWHGPKETAVHLRLRRDDHKHEIMRTTYPNALVLDDRAVGQEQIDKLIGLSFETFTHTILMGQGRPLFLELPPRDNLELFTAVLNLDVWEDRSESAAQITRKCDHDLIRLDQVKNLNETRLEQLKTQIEQTKVEHDRWEIERAKDDLASKAKLDALGKEQEGLQKERDQADLDYDSAMTEIKGLRREQAQLDETLQAVQDQRDAELRKIETYQAEREQIAKRLDRPLEVGDLCDNCGQRITGKGLMTHRRELTKRKTELKEKERELKHTSSQQEIEDLRRQLAAGRESLLRFQDKADAANDRMIALDPKLSDHRAKLAELQASKSRREREENPFELQLTLLKSQRAECVEDIKQAKEKFSEVSQQMERTAFWIKGFKEVRLFVIEETLRELEVASNALLDQFGLIGWAIRYSIERETQAGNISRALNVEIMSPHNPGPVKFESWSGGQRQRLRLVGSLALSDVLLERAGLRCSLEVLDEPSRSITRLGVRDMVDALADRAAQRQSQIYYTDHAAVESGRFASTICVVHDKEGARLELT